YNLRADRAVANIDITHRFVISYLYELPFGKGRKFGTDAHWLTNLLIGGWQFNGITTYQSGTPLSISANNTAGLFNPLTRPNTNGGNPQKSGRVQDRLGDKIDPVTKQLLNPYFDTNVFSQPA